MLTKLRLRSPGLPLLYMLPSVSVSFHSASSKKQVNAAVSTSLSRLPVPDLQKTLDRYLVSLKPFLLESEAHGGAPYDEALALRTKWVGDFKSGLGQTLQRRLQQLDEKSPNNWLDDNIWLKTVYHGCRAPLLVNSNWWLSFKNDSTIPSSTYLGLGENPELCNAGITQWQVRRAAWLVYRVLDFRARLERQEIYPGTSKTGIWFRTSAEKIFNKARLPRPMCDIFSCVPPKNAPAARTVVCAVRDWFYAIDVLDESLRPISPPEIETRILQIVTDAGKRLEAGEQAVPISVLSADHRDTWAENQSHLLSLSPKNQETLDVINHSIMGLSLDHYTYVMPTTYPNPLTPLPTPDSSAEVDAHLHNLRSSHISHPGRNRWHDKPFTLIVESNGRAGAMGEHSPVDALVPSIVADYAVVQAIDNDVFNRPIGSVDATTATVSESNATTGAGWRRLDWVTDDHIRIECEAAEERARQIVQDSDDSVLWFDAYGTEWIQEYARMSPDGYLQMAMQLAWYRTQGSFTATYETALTRMFKNGRTETIRVLTAASREWVLAMANPETPTHVLHSLLKRAIQAHSSLTREAIVGKGIDRHLLGLRYVMHPEDGEHHELFEDELFTRSQKWLLSTSALSAGDQFRGTGFGTPEHDGYGINYLAGPTMIKFGIESKYSCTTTSTKAFKDAIRAALLDIREVCRSVPLAHL